MAAVKKAEASMQASVAGGGKDYNEKLNEGARILARVVEFVEEENDFGKMAPVKLGLERKRKEK